MSRTSVDALRSLKRYVALALGDEWEVRTSLQEGSFERPSALVKSATGAADTSMHGQGVIEMVEPFVIYLYPEVGDSVDASLVLAGRAQQLLQDAFLFGVDRGRALRVPFYDYDDVAVNAGASDRLVVAVEITATGGTWKFSVGSEQTGPLAASASAAAIEAAVRALPSVAAAEYPAAVADEAAGDASWVRGVTVTEADDGRMLLAFSSLLGGALVCSVDGTGLSGGTVTATVADRPRRGEASHGAGAPALHGDYMRVSDPPSLRRVQDQDDDNLFTITCDIRLKWRRAGRVPSGAHTVSQVTIETTGS